MSFSPDESSLIDETHEAALAAVREITGRPYDDYKTSPPPGFKDVLQRITEALVKKKKGMGNEEDAVKRAKRMGAGLEAADPQTFPRGSTAPFVTDYSAAAAAKLGVELETERKAAIA